MKQFLHTLPPVAIGAIVLLGILIAFTVLRRAMKFGIKIAILVVILAALAWVIFVAR